MRTLIPTIVAASVLSACSPYVNGQFFLYSVDAWEPDGERVLHRRFIDDVDFPGVPEGFFQATYAYFLQLAIDQGATRRTIYCDGASLVVRDSAVPWSTFWAGEFELWAETESGALQQLATAKFAPDALMRDSLQFDPNDVDLMAISDDFETGAFDIVLKGTPAGDLDEMPPLELLVSFQSEAFRLGL